jgi:hypothetical protein
MTDGLGAKVHLRVRTGKIKSKGKVKNSGQECPLHANSGTIPC